MNRKATSFSSTKTKNYHTITFLALLLGLACTTAVSHWVETKDKEYSFLKFVDRCQEVEQKITARLQAQEQNLLSGAAMFEASTDVTRQEFQIYAKHLLHNQHFNGIQALGFSQWIQSEQLNAHEDAIRKTGFPDYHIKPEGKRDAYTAIVYIEPFSDRNLRAFGYDMYSEPVRRTAMARARDENEVTLSGKVTLVQETDADIQPGTLMFAPIYGKNKPLDTVEQRAGAIFGWVYSPFRMTDLLHNIIGNSALRLRVYDGNNVQPENLLYQNADNSLKSTFGEERKIVFNGTTWTLYFEQFTPWDTSKAWIVATAGTVISFLFFLFLRSHFAILARKADLIIQQAEKEKLAVQQALTNQQLFFQKTANEELLIQNAEKEKRTRELIASHNENEILSRQVNHMQKIESIGRLTAGIAHDFNNILACMLGFNEMNHFIAEDMPDEALKAELKSNTKQIEIAGQRAVLLIIKMMTYSRQDTVKENMTVKPTVEIIEEVLAMLRPALTSRIKLEVRLNCEQIIQIDAIDLHQIITNLVVNARDAMTRRDGIITISLNLVTSLKDQCTACSETLVGDFVELSVSDNGTGIQPQLVSQIFDPFFTTKEVGEGTGLGLSTVSGMVHHSQGHILVDSKLSEPNQGTAFRLLFPMSPDAATLI